MSFPPFSRRPAIVASILSADFARLGEEVGAVEAAGADWVQVDVMDGHFVPNITIGPPVVAALKRVTGVPLDVHLMIEEPDRYLEHFVEAGASMVTVHVEVLPHLHRTLTEIRHLGARAGVALNPSTPVAAIREVADVLDHVLIMSVNPGFGGQVFIPRSLDKIRDACALLNHQGRDEAVHLAVEHEVVRDFAAHRPERAAEIPERHAEHLANEPVGDEAGQLGCASTRQPAFVM